MIIYIEPNGTRHTALPRIWENASPITWEYLEGRGWTRQEIPDPAPEPEVKSYSPYALKRAIERRGIWEDVREAIFDAGYWDSLTLIQEIRADNDEFQAVLPVLRQKYPLIDVDAILSEAEI